MKLKNILLTAVIIAVPILTATAQNTDIDLVKQHLNTLAADDMLGRGFGTEAGNRAAEYIRSQFIDAGVEPLLEDYYHNFVHRQSVLNITGKNVVGGSV